MKPHTTHVGLPFVRTTYAQQGNQQHISSAITLTSCSCLFFVPRHPMMDSNNLLDPLCHTKWSNQENNTECSPKHKPNMYINTFTWTPVFKTGCRLCICYWHLSQYEKWMLPSPRIDIDKILLSDEVISWSLGKLTSSTATWAGINGPWNDRGRCFPSIIVHRGPANLSWWIWLMKSGAQMHLLQSLYWERCHQ